MRRPRLKRKIILWLSKSSKPDWQLVARIWRGVYPSPGSRPYGVEKFVMILLVLIRSLTSATLMRIINCFVQGLSESKTSEWCAIISFLLSIALLSVSSGTCIILRWATGIFAIYMIIGTLDYLLCIIFIDSKKEAWQLQSPQGSLILLFLNYLEITIAFGAIYICTRSICQAGCSNAITCPLDGLYFSFITIATLGYGDFRPSWWLGKLISIIEVTSGLFLIALFLAIILQEFRRKPRK